MVGGECEMYDWLAKRDCDVEGCCKFLITKTKTIKESDEKCSTHKNKCKTNTFSLSFFSELKLTNNPQQTIIQNKYLGIVGSGYERFCWLTKRGGEGMDDNKFLITKMKTIKESDEKYSTHKKIKNKKKSKTNTFFFHLRMSINNPQRTRIIN